MEIKHTESFDLAYRFVTETNLNIFLTGKAGTGKTTFLRYLRQHSYKKMVVAAPTGVAAINAGGVTLHSLFQLPFAPFVPSKDVSGDAVNSHSLLSQIRYNREKLNLLRNLELLVIDETSMVASHTVDAIDTILRSIKRRHQLPFGGAQVLFIGDLHQLPP
ncbi:MAG TPA: AAA family ATPase, partial [Bacteroidia bacterium]|nr:AAA family ATPase [Bacteroidia bacterium]